MSAPPVPRYLNAAAELGEVIEAFNQFQLESIQGASARLTRQDNFASGARTGIKFMSPASGAASVTFRTGLSAPIEHLVCSWLTQDNGGAVGGPWSCVATNISSTQVTATFTGLAASTAFTASFLLE